LIPMGRLEKSVRNPGLTARSWRVSLFGFLGYDPNRPAQTLGESQKKEGREGAKEESVGMDPAKKTRGPFDGIWRDGTILSYDKGGSSPNAERFRCRAKHFWL